MIIDYTVAVECENPEVYYTCWQCGKCGRKFENGIMIDDGGTTIDEEEQAGTGMRCWCKIKERWCELAHPNGYCMITACTKAGEQ